MTGSRSQSLTQTVLHSVDSGNHSCVVTDSLGNQGTATIQVTVTGKYHTKLMSLTPIFTEYILF